MSQNELDPAANTMMFQAFVDRLEAEDEPTRSPWIPVLLTLAGLVALVAVAAVAWTFLA